MECVFFEDTLEQLPSTQYIASNTTAPVIVIEVPPDNLQRTELQVNTPAKNSCLSTDNEYLEPVVVITSGRKRNKINERKCAQGLRHQLPKTWVVCCPHKDISSSKCNVASLVTSDIQCFKNNLCLLNKKIDQDKFLLTMMTIEKPKRKNRGKGIRQERTVVSYFVPTEKGDLIQVCLNAFVGITSITRRRLNILASTFKNTHASPKESRGGFPLSKKIKAEEVTTSIKNHILKFKSRKSHYSRSDTGRSYLQPELSVKKMWSHWKNKRTTLKLPLASFSKYYKVFTKNFNLSFGHPRQDVCSFCTQKLCQIKNEKDDIKEVLQIELKEHKAKSKYFSKMLSFQLNDTIQISFDMMQNQPLPKLSVTETFYSRQVWLYNLTFVINSENDQSKKNCFLYTWLETESGRGPNEIGSALIHFLNILENRYKTQMNPPTNLNLYSDSCAGQNKNQYIMATLLNYINCKETIFKKITHIFPVRGHSYMPPDRVFGRIEKELRKRENIVSPSEYYAIFNNFCHVLVYNRDFKVYNIKEACKSTIKSKTFKMTEQKRLLYEKNKKTVGISTNYMGEYDNYVKVLKRNSKIEAISTLAILDKCNHVKPPKQDDVRKLMKFFNIPIDAIDFYNDIFANVDEKEDADEEINEDGAVNYFEDSMY